MYVELSKNREVGRIVFYIPERKFGFIHTPDGREFFFHVSNFLRGCPALSLNVEFETAPAIREGKSEQAVRIIPVAWREKAEGKTNQSEGAPAERKGEGGAL